MLLMGIIKMTIKSKSLMRAPAQFAEVKDEGNDRIRTGIGLAFTVDLATVADLHDKNKQRFILDLVDDAIVTHAKAVQVVVSGQLFDATGAGIFCQ
jgi:hypothetical protein